MFFNNTTMGSNTSSEFGESNFELALLNSIEAKGGLNSAEMIASNYNRLATMGFQISKAAVNNALAKQYTASKDIEAVRICLQSNQQFSFVAPEFSTAKYAYEIHANESKRFHQEKKQQKQSPSLRTITRIDQPEIQKCNNIITFLAQNIDMLATKVEETRKLQFLTELEQAILDYVLVSNHELQTVAVEFDPSLKESAMMFRALQHCSYLRHSREALPIEDLSKKEGKLKTSVGTREDLFERRENLQKELSDLQQVKDAFEDFEEKALRCSVGNNIIADLMGCLRFIHEKLLETQEQEFINLLQLYDIINNTISSEAMRGIIENIRLHLDSRKYIDYQDKISSINNIILNFKSLDETRFFIDRQIDSYVNYVKNYQDEALTILKQFDRQPMGGRTEKLFRNRILYEGKIMDNMYMSIEESIERMGKLMLGEKASVSKDGFAKLFTASQLKIEQLQREMDQQNVYLQRLSDDPLPQDPRLLSSKEFIRRELGSLVKRQDIRISFMQDKIEKYTTKILKSVLPEGFGGNKPVYAQLSLDELVDRLRRKKIIQGEFEVTGMENAKAILVIFDNVISKLDAIVAKLESEIQSLDEEDSYFIAISKLFFALAALNFYKMVIQDKSYDCASFQQLEKITEKFERINFIISANQEVAIPANMFSVAKNSHIAAYEKIKDFADQSYNHFCKMIRQKEKEERRLDIKLQESFLPSKAYGMSG